MQIKLRDVSFGQTISQQIEDHPNILDFIFVSNKANFRLRDYVNKQSVCFWT